jgi:DNA-binding response OmpR family regulator
LVAKIAILVFHNCFILKKILIIENDIDTLNIIGFIFGDSEFEVVESEKEIPIDDIIRLNPNIVLIDHFLEDSKGSQLCLEIKSNILTNKIPVIRCSTSVHLAQFAHDCYADAFISKPFNMDDIVQLVNELIYKINSN